MKFVSSYVLWISWSVSAGVHGWSTPTQPPHPPATTPTTLETTGRRAFFSYTAAAVAAATATTTTLLLLPTDLAVASGFGSKDSVVQREINTFESLIYNFKNTALDGGLDASTLNEPSISFVEFGEKMKKGEVTFVEFMAPTGAVAYATLKKSKKRVRIGQGYPTGGKNSWSSPDFVIRSVSNFNVPYKFTVPALSNVKYAKY